MFQMRKTDGFKTGQIRQVSKLHGFSGLQDKHALSRPEKAASGAGDIVHKGLVETAGINDGVL